MKDPWATILSVLVVALVFCGVWAVDRFPWLVHAGVLVGEGCLWLLVLLLVRSVFLKKN